jgi:hypothetical protein
VLKPINCLARVTISNPLALAALGRGSLAVEARFLRALLALEINGVLVPNLYSVLVARSGSARSEGVVHQVGRWALDWLALGIGLGSGYWAARHWAGGAVCRVEGLGGVGEDGGGERAAAQVVCCWWRPWRAPASAQRLH